MTCLRHTTKMAMGQATPGTVAVVQSRRLAGHRAEEIPMDHSFMVTQPRSWEEKE